MRVPVAVVVMEAAVAVVTTIINSAISTAIIDATDAIITAMAANVVPNARTSRNAVVTMVTAVNQIVFLANGITIIETTHIEIGIMITANAADMIATTVEVLVVFAIKMKIDRTRTGRLVHPIISDPMIAVDPESIAAMVDAMMIVDTIMKD